MLLSLSIHGQNEDVEKDFSQSKKYFEKGLSLNSSYEPLYSEMSHVYLGLSRNAFKHNSAPLDYTKLSSELAEKGLAIDPSSPWDYQFIVESSILEAKWKILNKQNPLSSLQKAKRSIDQIIHITGQSATTYDEEAEIDYCQAQWNILNHQQVQPLIDKGLKEVEIGMKMNSDSPELYHTRGRFHLLKADTLSDSPQRLAEVKIAQEDFKHAILLNSNLEKEYTKELQELQKTL